MNFGAGEGIDEDVEIDGREEVLVFERAIHSDPSRVPTPMLTTPRETARATYSFPVEETRY